MIIYPLPPQELDDVTLSKQVKNIAQVLCNAHYMFWPEKITKDIPLPHKFDNLKLHKYSQWARECLANYLSLVERGLECCEDWIYRFKQCICDSQKRIICVHHSIIQDKFLYKHKLQAVIEWCEKNVPDLKSCALCKEGQHLATCIFAKPFPIVMPEKYKRYHLERYRAGLDTIDQAIIESYRAYYKAKIDKLKLKHELWKDEAASIAGAGHVQSVNEYLNTLWTRRQKPLFLA